MLAAEHGVKVSRHRQVLALRLLMKVSAKRHHRVGSMHHLEFK
jgi:hypothetical protein